MVTILVKDEQPSKKTQDGRERVFLVGKEITGSKHLAADVVTYSPGARNKYHYHKSESFIYIIEGECDMTVNGVVHHLKEGTMVYLPPGDKHWLQNNSGSKNMVMIEAFAPEADITPYYPEQER
jgi:quercetin dioxygenase-like cupin family protein